ncbi:MAG: hypothetical protein J7496_16325 [Novosphingobium sp.]|nr:hypothetical protein [Novosphingobium sp.]
MNRLLLGALGLLAFAAVGLFWWQGRAEVERGAPPPVAPGPPKSDALPLADAKGLKGPAPPAATELDQEQQRFARYDRNRDWKISRNEMLSTRADAFRKLDKDGNNLLTFEEWAVATVDRFDKADANRDGWLSEKEFATTRPPPVRKPKCKC